MVCLCIYICVVPGLFDSSWILEGSQIEIWLTYALLTILLGGFQWYAITISWYSKNSNSVRSRAVSAAPVNMSSQPSGIVGSNTYRNDDKPLCYRGNSWMISSSAISLVLSLALRQYYIWEKRAKGSSLANHGTPRA